MRSLAGKLMLGFLVVCLVEAVLVVVFARHATEREFDHFVRERFQGEFAAQLERYYQREGSWGALQEHSWEGLREHFWTGWSRREGREGRGVKSRRDRYVPLFTLVDDQGRVVLPAGEWRAGATVDRAVLAQGLPLEVDGRQVGTIVRVETNHSFGPRERHYLARTYTVLLYALIGSLAIALVLAAIFARNFTRPLRQLTGAADLLAQGRLGHQVPVRSKDELGQLSQAFNQMSAELERVNALRRQMTADIAHDLRTPLTTLSGYLEAMRDGVLAPEPQRLEMMYGEIRHLNHLVDDLRVLALADAGELALQPQALSLAELLGRTQAAFAHRAAENQIGLEVECAADVHCLADPVRLEQIMDNLLDNALRHTPAGGSVQLHARTLDEEVEIGVRDTGSGIPAADLPHIFERFYQVDKARSQGEGTGLGLAIARSLVEAQQGRISVESPPGQGTIFRIYLPAST